MSRESVMQVVLSNRLVRMRVVILPPLLHTLRSISWLIHKVHMRHVERTRSKHNLRHVFPFLDLFLYHSERKVAWSSTRSWIVRVLGSLFRISLAAVMMSSLTCGSRVLWSSYGPIQGGFITNAYTDSVLHYLSLLRDRPNVMFEQTGQRIVWGTAHGYLKRHATRCPRQRLYTLL